VIVLSDTSPINYLILTGEIEILPALFGQVVIPTAVLQELQHAGTPAEVQQWISKPPA
jgi:predicted nucleic acid-binding protein